MNGDIKNERDNLEEGHEVIVFYSGDLVYLITNTDGQTRVKVCEQSKLTQEDWKIIDRTLISSHILDNYATMVRLGIIRTRTIVSYYQFWQHIQYKIILLGGLL